MVTAGSEPDFRDWYDYIDSRDVREYLRSTGFAVSPDGALYLIWICGRLSVEETHEHWRRILMEERCGCRAVCLAAEAMREEERLLEQLTGNGPYPYEWTCHEDGGRTVIYRRSSSLKECADPEGRNGLTEVSRKTADGGRVYCTLDRRGRIMQIAGEGRSGWARGFDGLAFEFPSPFTEGETLRVTGGEGIFATAPLKYLGCRFEPGLGMLADCEYTDALGKRTVGGQMLLRLER